jgi:serine/threonine protein phosphatase 1
MVFFPRRELFEKGDSRLLAVGDIHGCLDHLENLLDKVRPVTADRIVFLGDYVDRGPESRGVIEYLIDFARRFPATVFLKGNHEQMFLDFLSGRDRLTFLINGGTATLDSYRKEAGSHIPGEHREFLQRLVPFYETDRFIFVHAGLRPGLPLHKQSEEDFLWIREDFLNSDFDWGKTIVYGHTPGREPFFGHHRIGVDTGAVYGRMLTCCDVERRRCWTS